MTSTNYLPGITDIRFYKSDGSYDEPLIKCDKIGKTTINLEFTLFGLDKLQNQIDKHPEDFFVYCFLFFHNGGVGTEVVTSTSFYFSPWDISNEAISVISTLEFSPNLEGYDFINNYYSLEVIYSKNSAQDGSDLNFILNNDENKLFKTKLALVGDHNE